MDGLTMLVNESDNTVTANRNDWNQLPERLQDAIMQNMQGMHPGIKLVLTDGSPYDGVDPDTISDQPVHHRVNAIDGGVTQTTEDGEEITSLALPSDTRVATLHYSNGAVEVAVRTRTGWVRVLEGGEHACKLATPYYETVRPVTAVIVARLPKSGFGSASLDDMLEYGERNRRRPQQDPIMMDMSEQGHVINIPQEEDEDEDGSIRSAADLKAFLLESASPEVREKMLEFQEKVDNIQEKAKSHRSLDEGEAARVLFEAMYDTATLVIDSEGTSVSEVGKRVHPAMA